MSEEERKAIEETKNALSKIVLGIDVDFDINTLDVLLNLIEKQQKEIEKLKKQSENLDKEAQSYLEELMGDNGMKKRTIAQLQAEIEKKNKIIDLMAEWLYEDDTSFGYGNLKEVNTKEKIKQYFERRVEDVKN